MQSIIDSWFVQGMIKATSDMWLKGWDERNGGNVSLRLLEEEVAPFRADFNAQPRCVELTQPATELANSWFWSPVQGSFSAMCKSHRKKIWCYYKSAQMVWLTTFIGD